MSLLQSHSNLINLFVTVRNLHFFFKNSGNDTKDKIAPEDGEDEGAGEEEVEDGDSHPTNLDGEA